MLRSFAQAVSEALSSPPPRSFWGEDLVAKAFATTQPRLASALSHAVKGALSALLHEDPSLLDELSEALVEVQVDRVGWGGDRLEAQPSDDRFCSLEAWGRIDFETSRCS